MTDDDLVARRRFIGNQRIDAAISHRSRYAGPHRMFARWLRLSASPMAIEIVRLAYERVEFGR